MTRHLHAVRALLLLAAMAAGALAIHAMVRQAELEKSVEAAALLEEYAASRTGDAEAGLVLSLPLQNGCPPQGHPLPLFSLRWIQFSEQSDGPHYALFLPAAAQTASLRVFVGEESLVLDGQPLQNGQMLALAAGEHLLAAQNGPNEGKEWPFVAMYGSEIPSLFIETFTGSLDAIHADKAYSESATFTLLAADGSLEHAGDIEGMRGRGNVTWGAEKKPYQLTLPERMSLLGMPAARRWLLIANAFDKSLLRNQTAFALAGAAGVAFTPESRQVELYVNGEYQGCYLLCEKVEVGDGRVDIPSLEKRNLAAALDTGQPWEEEPLPWQSGRRGEPGHRRYTGLEDLPGAGEGGWLFELELPERYLEDHKPGFISRLGQPVCVQSPASASRQQVEEMAALYQRLEDALYPTAEGPAEPLEELIDLRSFARKYLVEEIVKNLDASMSSQYLYKLPDAASPRLYAGPVWDYDKSLAGSGAPWEDLAVIADPAGFWANQQQTEYTLWSALYDQPAFRAAVEESFWQDFVPAADRLLGEGLVALEARRLADSAVMDAMRWQGGGYPYDPDTFPEEYLAEAEKIEAFLAARMVWLQGQWPKDTAA